MRLALRVSDTSPVTDTVSLAPKVSLTSPSTFKVRVLETDTSCLSLTASVCAFPMVIDWLPVTLSVWSFCTVTERSFCTVSA